MYEQAERDAQRFWEPACPKCFEPFSTEAPDVDEDDDRRPVLRYARRSVCASCFCQAASERRGAEHAPTACIDLQWDYELIGSIIEQQHIRHKLVERQRRQRRSGRRAESSRRKERDLHCRLDEGLNQGLELSPSNCSLQSCASLCLWLNQVPSMDTTSSISSMSSAASSPRNRS